MSDVTPQNTRFGGVIPSPENITVEPSGAIMAAGAEATAMFALIAMRRGLRLEITTGMKLSRGSVLSTLQARGITVKRTKKAAYADLNAYIVQCGGIDLPLG